jgi:hypothetical protein
MYLFYIDESGDTGKINSPSRYFVLSAICIHESAWHQFLDEIVTFRRHLKKKYGLLMSEEIHAGVFINGSPNLKAGISLNDKLLILKECLLFLNGLDYISIVTVKIEKVPQYNNDIYEYAWRLLIQRIENTLIKGNFMGGVKTEQGILMSDNTNWSKLKGILRKMRRYNLIPSRYGGTIDAKIISIIEDPVCRDSGFSYAHQMADVVCYFARQYYEPNRKIKKKGASKYYVSLHSVLNKYTTTTNTLTYIVEERA